MTPQDYGNYGGNGGHGGPSDYGPPPLPAGTRLLAGCGGALLGMALVGGIGGVALWQWTVRTADASRGDRGIAEFGIVGYGVTGFGIALAFLWGVLFLFILAIIAGCVGGMLSLKSANRSGRVPGHAMFGFVLAAGQIVYITFTISAMRTAAANAGQRAVALRQTRRMGRTLPPSVSPASASTPTTPPPQSAPQTPPTTNDTATYARPETRPTPEEIREFARQAQEDAPSVLGEWLYPGAQAIPFTPHPGEIRYPLLGLQTTDSFESAVAFYERLAPGGTRDGEAYILHGKRPSDGRQTEIRISQYQNKTFIRFDAR